MVIGVGGIGLNVIQGLALSDALPIIAVDTNPAKEALARQFGATHFIDARPGLRPRRGGQGDLPERRRLRRSSASGHPALIRQAIDLLDWGGTA